MEGQSIKELAIIFKTVKNKTTTAEEGQERAGSIGMDKLEGLWELASSRGFQISFLNLLFKWSGVVEKILLIDITENCYKLDLFP